MKPGLYVARRGTIAYSLNNKDMGFIKENQLVLVLDGVNHAWMGLPDGWQPTKNVAYVKAVYQDRLLFVSAWWLEDQ